MRDRLTLAFCAILLLDMVLAAMVLLAFVALIVGGRL